MADELFDARNALTVGNYHQAIAEASSARSNGKKADEVELFNAEREAVLALTQIGLGQHESVVSQLRSATHPLLLSVRHWGEFLLAMKRNSTSGEAASADVASALAQLTGAAEVVDVDAAYKAIYATAALIQVQDTAAAITLAKRWLKEFPNVSQGVSSATVRRNVELRSLVVEALLRLNRPDQARHELQAMENLDDESLCTLLCNGNVALHMAQLDHDKAKYSAALACFKDISMRCGQSVMLLNLIAVAQMGAGEFQDAERTLLDALGMRSGDEDIMANLAVVSAHLGKADAAERYLQQAAAASTSGMWGQRYAQKVSQLDSVVESF